MFAQTIALFRYQLVGLVNRRLLFLLVVVAGLALLVGQFVGALALVEAGPIRAAMIGEFMRVALSIALVALLAVQVTQDYASGQFERMLAMPIHRAQYLLALFTLQAILSGLLAFAGAIVLIPFAPLEDALYWFLALWLELILLGQFVALSALTLERLAPVLMLTLALYLLARGAPFIELVLQRSAQFYEGESGFEWASELFSWIRLFLPGADAFANNDQLMGSDAPGVTLLGRQLLQVGLYSLFLEAVILADFYRKEFGRS